MIACAFVIPGDIGLPTGGYEYDRQVLALLPVSGVAVTHVALPGSFPDPGPADLAETERVLAALPASTVLLIDGLAYGAMPAEIIARIRQPIVALCHHPLALEAGLAPERADALRQSEIAALGFARRVVATSRITGQGIVRDFGVASDRLTIAEPGTVRAERAIGSAGAGPLHLLAVGSIVPRKGYDVLIAALSGLKHLPWRLTIAGADTLSPETTLNVRALIAAEGLSGRVRMLGAIDRSALGGLYAGADLFVMPSLFEGYGMVLAEAMARGLPIVCTTGGAAAETAPDAAALKVSPGDAAAFRDAVRRALEDAPLRASMADASWAAGQRLPRWDDTARIIAGVLKEVAA